MTDTKHYIGHRQRVKEKVINQNANGFSDYELVEALLFLSQPRVDTKPIAKNLLKKFPSLIDLFAACPKELKQVPGVGDHSIFILKLIQEVAKRMGKEALPSRLNMGDDDQIVRYCRLRMLDPKVEQFHVFFLDGHYQLITEIIHQKGTVDQAAVYPREILKEALTCGASWLILAHNHPSGKCIPSEADIDLTNYIIAAGEKLGIRVYDHFVFSTSAHTSFRKLKLIS